MELPPNLKADEASPEWMNKGDNAWQLTAATLVGLQCVPGLVILYGGMVKKKWAINSAFMALYAFAAVLICWVGWGYRMSFGEKLVGFLGRPAVAVDENFLLGQPFLGYFPTATMVLFQFVFAAITPVLIGGALIGRMNFVAWMMFVPLWHTFSYTVGAFSIWCPDGWLAKLGVIDFAGGFVIHLSSGVAGFTAAHWVGPRLDKDRDRFPPNNILMMLAGAGMPSVLGAVQGIITGLVCITPGAGVVQCWAAILMGLISGSVPWYTMTVLHNKVKLLRHVDDTFAVFHTHAIAGALGGILTGFFAVPKLSRLFYLVPDWEKYIGLTYGLQTGRTSAGLRQMGAQLAGAAFIICLNIVTTSLICLGIRLVVPLRLGEEELQVGDEAVHGEVAYALWDGNVVKYRTVKTFYAQREEGMVIDGTTHDLLLPTALVKGF
nr:ammonium transporter 3 member 1-like [Ipomoea batatas]